MQQKAFTLLNRGMNRDLSISKAGESSAYENHNIRIIARDNDTLLSVTNERGNTQIPLGPGAHIFGNLIGWNVLNDHIILFTHEEINNNNVDRIYRISWCENNAGVEGFWMRCGSEYNKPLFEGDLDFDLEHPIESVVYYETEDIQKIYWVDGKNVLRFMNFIADDEEIARWSKNNDNTYFDSNRKADFGVKATIEKDNSGNTRANGVVQYLLTYYNKHGQETGYVWASDLVYLSPVGKGGAADGTNSNKVTITFTNLDTSFTNYRVYCIFRSSLNITPVAYIVADGEIEETKTVTRVVVSNTGRSAGESSSSGAHRTSSYSLEQSTASSARTSRVQETVTGYAQVVDDGAHLVTEDVLRLLYLGSQNVVAGTLTHKDQTLFVGDLQSIGKGEDYTAIQTELGKLRDDNGILGDCLEFVYSSDDTTGAIGSIPYHEDTGTYVYKSQLELTSSQIMTFKGGEKYRFALTFRRQDGTTTEAFWLGDKENALYPVIDTSKDIIRRVVVKFTLQDSLIAAIRTAGFETAQLMIAEATYADRSVKAQGIINPTMFNVWERYNERLYSQASWISRPRNSGVAWKHFEPVHNSTSSTGEIDCNYWEEDINPTPYYSRRGDTFVDEFDGMSSGDYRMILYVIQHVGAYYWAQVWFFSAELNEGTFTPSFDETDLQTLLDNGVLDEHDYAVTLERTAIYKSPNKTHSAASLYPIIKAACKDELGLDIATEVIGEEDFVQACNSVDKGETLVYNRRMPGSVISDVLSAMNYTYGWENLSETVSRSDVNYVPSYFRKHLMFVDENVVTLNSPEITYEAVSFDNAENYKLRIVGVARITSTVGDYTVDATPGKLPGENLVREKFVGNTDGIISWPLWKEYGLKEKVSTTENPITIPTNFKKRSSEHYDWLEQPVIYWLHMWNHSGKINGFTDEDNSDYSRLNSKIFANLRYSYNTIYNASRSNDWTCILPSGSLRLFNYTSSQYVGLKIDSKNVLYDANIDQSLLVPGSHKYKVLYSRTSPNVSSDTVGDLAYLYLDTPVQLSYLSSPHAVIKLTSSFNNNVLSQTILPYINSGDASSVPTTSFIPWSGSEGTRYNLTQSKYNIAGSNGAGSLELGDKYLFIGEIYYDYSADGVIDTRYGSVENNRFVTAGPQYTTSELGRTKTMYANQGDTYFQRWDCLKTKPYSVTDATNGVIDITSVMLETHINIDGRTDNQRETGYIASIDTEKYGSLNKVYSQQDNFFAQRDLDEDFNLDNYGSTITWTLEKADSAEIDEWSHITLASTLKLDGDKGKCQALRRFQNSIIAFQDRGIAEVLFNSRTQLTTTDGVPVEIANSGKVDGKRYITNKFGCINKWSIVEGKSALYFVDNINKSFCAFNGNVESLSTRLGFDVWFRRHNRLKPWAPTPSYENLVSYYDRIHSDVYLVGDRNDPEPCLVYNEMLGMFTSFFDYSNVPMMTNVRDRFVSFRDTSLWFQNEGRYCRFFGTSYDYWTIYRITPDPYGDKIWTNLEYRADFYHVLGGDDSVLNDSFGMIPAEKDLISPDRYGYLQDAYKENETFTTYKLWNEYQTTGDVPLTKNDAFTDPVRKKFRIWRLTVPRALKGADNKRGLDRIRNPWINLEFRKHMDDDRYLMQLHDIVIKYFE